MLMAMLHAAALHAQKKTAVACCVCSGDKKVLCDVCGGEWPVLLLYAPTVRHTSQGIVLPCLRALPCVQGSARSAIIRSRRCRSPAAVGR